MAAQIIGYELRYRVANSNAMWQVHSYPADTTTLHIPGLSRGATYEAEARSLGDNGTVSYWVPVTIVVGEAANVPLQPISFSVTTVADGVALKWDAPGAQRSDVEYVVQRANDAAGVPGTYAQVARVRALHYTDPVTDQLTRWYRVKAVAFSGVESLYTPALNKFGKAVGPVASETAPVNPTNGTTWYQPSTKLTRYWNGTGWSIQADNSLDTQQTATLVKDGGFEAGGQNWSAIGANGLYLEESTNAAYFGTRGLIKAPNGGVMVQPGCAYFAASPGETLLAECMMRNLNGAANGGVSLRLWFYNDAGAFVSLGAFQYWADAKPAANGWRKATCAAVVPAGVAKARVGVEIGADHTVGYWAFDQFRATKVTQTEESASANLLLNANFGGTNGTAFPWTVSWDSGGVGYVIRNKAQGLYSGATWTISGTIGVIEIRQGALSSSGVVDLSSITASQPHQIPIEPERRYQAHAKIAAHRTKAQVGIVWFAADHSYISEVWGPYVDAYGGKNEADYAHTGLFAVAPANARYAGMWFRRQNTPVGQVDSYTWYIKPYFGTAALNQVAFSPWSEPAPAYADSISAGQRGVIDIADLWEPFGSRRLGLRYKGSGHRLGDQRNLPQSNTTAYGSVRNVTALSATYLGVVTVNAHTVRYGGVSISYSGVPNAISGLAAGRTYVIYCFDDDYQGGVRTWYAGTNPDQVMQLGDGVVVAGQVTIPSSGSGGGGGGGGGGDPGDWCVDYGTAVLPDGRYVRDLAVGDLVPCWNLDADNPAIEMHPVLSIAFGWEQSYTLGAACGALIQQSASTPMVMRDGITLRTDELEIGEELLVNRDGVMTWQKIVLIEGIGVRRVVKMSVGDRVFFAGVGPHATIATHNAIAKP